MTETKDVILQGRFFFAVFQHRTGFSVCEITISHINTKTAQMISVLKNPC